ncbi:MAG: hypothetical protein CBD16_05625 [Betaproteobacteria bacterium TMED156]|nr:MAG: hypothetical protein CBD16_05625 [Betaproteobacteria bacterium TMED156]
MRKFLFGLLFSTPMLFVCKSSYGLDLIESISLSKNNDSLFLIANTKINIVKESEEQAFSQMLPSVSLRIARSQVKQDREDNLQKFPTQNYTTESDAITLNQPLYRPQLLSDFRRAKKLTSSTRYDARNEEQNLLLRVSFAYLNALSSTDNTQLQLKKIDLLKEQKRFAEKSIIAGTATKTDLLEISVSLDRANATLIQIEQQQEVAMAELSVLTGNNVKKINSFNHKSFNPKDFDPGKLESWQENSKTHNPQIKSRGERLQAAEITIKSAKYAHYPTIDLTAQVSRGSSESTFFVNSSTETQSVGLTFSLPIYSGGFLNSKVRQSIQQLNLESEELRKLENELKIKIQDSYNSVMEKKSLIKALEKAEDSAKNLLVANERSVELGIRRRLDVLVSQQQLISVQKDLAQTRFELISSWLSLHFNSGFSLDKEIDFINSFLIKISKSS